MTYNSKNDNGAHAPRADEVQANEYQGKLPWFRGLILWTELLALWILNRYKGSAWAPAFAGVHASGRAGQHFDNLRCSCPIWHALNFKVMPRV